MVYTPKTWALNTLIKYTDMNNLESGIQEIYSTGMIMMWYGLSTAVPAGWHICDGTVGTPDLRDKFVVGAGTTYAKGATGGEATHTLTIEEMPAHTHSTTVPKLINNDHNMGIYAGHHATSAETDSTGGGSAHNNLPPYHAVFFIMKI